MQIEFENIKSAYFCEIDLTKIHVHAKDNALAKVISSKINKLFLSLETTNFSTIQYQQKRKFGGAEFIAICQNELEIAIDDHYSNFRMKNERMKNQHSSINYWWNVSWMAGGVVGLGAGVATILAPYAAGFAVLSLIRSISK